MANLERIQANNAELQECIDKANALPDAGSGEVIIPDGYHDVSGVTAAAGDVLAGSKFVDNNGNIVTGTIPVITGERSLDRDNDFLEYEDGYYSAMLNSAYVDWEDITITPTAEEQLITKGKFHEKAFFRNITVEPIPSDYIKPSGTKEITESGTYDVKNFASVNVNVSTGEDVTAETNEYTAKLETLEAAIAELEAELEGKAAGEGGGNVTVSLLTREITEYSNPTLTKLGAYAMSGTNITTLDLPALTTIDGYAFYECTKLTYVNFPKLTSIPYNGMRQFKGLVKADFSALTSIGSNGFYQCTALETLIIRTNTVCTLASGSTLTGSPILNGTGYIYVPSALVDSYKAATNWSALASQFRAIEDYPDICGGNT